MGAVGIRAYLLTTLRGLYGPGHYKKSIARDWPSQLIQHSSVQPTSSCTLTMPAEKAARIKSLCRRSPSFCRILFL
jgi:hypothetical protein